MEAHHCPICGVALKVLERYPRYVCADCARKVVATDGRELRITNEAVWGGYLATYADTGERYHSHDCYIDDVPCHADEARFGGIVVQT